jgi:predicted metalloprotease with PDZ domain
MPWSIMSHIQRWKKDKQVHSWQDEECNIDDLFTKVVAVEVIATDLTLRLKKENKRIEVTDVGNESDAGLCDGDVLLAIGSIDVETSSLEHVNELLEKWPRNKTVPLLLVRDSV